MLQCFCLSFNLSYLGNAECRFLLESVPIELSLCKLWCNFLKNENITKTKKGTENTKNDLTGNSSSLHVFISILNSRSKKTQMTIDVQTLVINYAIKHLHLTSVVLLNESQHKERIAKEETFLNPIKVGMPHTDQLSANLAQS